MNKLKKLISKCKVCVDITINNHRAYYGTVKQDLFDYINGRIKMVKFINYVLVVLMWTIVFYLTGAALMSFITLENQLFMIEYKACRVVYSFIFCVVSASVAIPRFY